MYKYSLNLLAECIAHLDESLLTKQIYIGCLKQMNSKCKTWFYRVNTFLACHDMEQVSREQARVQGGGAKGPGPPP